MDYKWIISGLLGPFSKILKNLIPGIIFEKFDTGDHFENLILGTISKNLTNPNIFYFLGFAKRRNLKIFFLSVGNLVEANNTEKYWFISGKWAWPKNEGLNRKKGSVGVLIL